MTCTGGIFSVIKRSPRADELPRYDYDQADRSYKVYGVAALRPNLSASGLVLILEGTSMAGTEAAADFVFDDALLLPFLKKIQSQTAHYLISKCCCNRTT
jgi:hypothetical protein